MSISKEVRILLHSILATLYLEHCIGPGLHLLSFAHIQSKVIRTGAFLTSC